jgi:hypothetical protein
MQRGGCRPRRPGGVTTFELSALRAASVPPVRPPDSPDSPLLAGLAGREFRFAVPGAPAARLPRDSQATANLWKSISLPPQHGEASWSSEVWTALMAPASRIPLTPPAGCGQEFAVVSVVEAAARLPVLAIVRIGLAARTGRYAHAVIDHASAAVESDPDAMAHRLEALFIEALPQARSQALRGAARALWLGGDRAVAAGCPVWRGQVEALCAVMGLRAEIVEEPARRVRSIRTALGDTATAGHLLVWQPKCRGAEQLVRSYRELCADGEVVVLSEATFPGALAEARHALIGLGLADPAIGEPSGSSRRPPVAGAERFYIKVGGSKAGDVLVPVADCGHGQWGGDARRKAPRAVMGLERLEGVRPRSLFRCARCTKHRWRARF